MVNPSRIQGSNSYRTTSSHKGRTPMGVKSAQFGCIWKTLFITAMCYPEKINHKNKEHILKKKHYKQFYDSLQYTLPCRYCKEFTHDILMKELPLDFSGRIPLMYSLYLWKDRINKKLIAQGCKKTKPSPSFEVILKKYEKLRAKCSKKEGKCI